MLKWFCSHRRKWKHDIIELKGILDAFVTTLSRPPRAEQRNWVVKIFTSTSHSPDTWFEIIHTGCSHRMFSHIKKEGRKKNQFKIQFSGKQRQNQGKWFYCSWYHNLGLVVLNAPGATATVSDTKMIPDMEQKSLCKERGRFKREQRLIRLSHLWVKRCGGGGGGALL